MNSTPPFGKPQYSGTGSRKLPRRQVLAMGGAALAAAGIPLRLRATPEKVDVAIIGAGLSGLYAGMLLSELGASVLVLEASDRPGGRCLTVEGWELKPDLGASQIGATYARVIDTCNKLDIELGAGSHMNAPYTPVVNGQLVPAETWADSPLNLTVGDEREALPHTLAGFYISRRTPFDDINDWRRPEAAEYDISIAEWLRREGASPEARRIIHESLGLSPLEEKSVLRMLQEATRGRMEMDRLSAEKRKGLDQYEIASLISSHVVGGTSRLTDAMAASVGDRVRLGSPVTAIEQGPERCTVRLADGESVSADFVLAATPFSSLRRIAFDPPLEGVQAEAVADMPYNSQSQIWFIVKEPYWEDDGMGASMWTDGPLQYVRQQIEPNGDRIKMSAIASSRKGERLDAMSPRERGAFALAEIERIRPSTRGKLEVMGVHSWAQGDHYGGCSFELPVGRVLDWVQHMGKPHGRVHFAGEHLRETQLGMEAAMESGERAAIEIVTRLMA
jgi:monoamine oxidase